jgi:hypothetical protein
MKRSTIKTCAQKAYTLHLDNSGLSLTEKSNRFARFFAYEVAASGFPNNGDRAGCLPQTTRLTSSRVIMNTYSIESGPAHS